jgi:hypothetical protein
MLEDEARLLLVRRASGSPSGLLRLARPATLALATGIPPPCQDAGQTADGLDDQLVAVLQDVKNTQLVACLRPQLGQDGRVEVGAIRHDHARQQAPLLEVVQETPHVRRVVAADQGASHGQVRDRVGGQQQREAAQVQFIDTQRARELGNDHVPVRQQVKLGDLPAQAIVDEAF